jgi:L-aminopeptidase/D-esterase-like protein
MNPRHNLITDVAGVLVGNAEDAGLASGVTAALFEEPAVASCAVLGGAPGTRETDLLEPDAAAPGVDAVVLSGGSAFGLDAASGVQAWLRERGIGFPVGPVRVPLVPQAIVFDLLNGGDKGWGRYPPYRELGYAAAAAAGRDFALGTAGGGYGATTYGLKGGLGHPARVTPEMRRLAWKGGSPLSTTIALVATDAVLTKAQAKRLAVAAHGGLARALRVAHALHDGDAVFAAATGRRPLGREPGPLIEIGALAADCLARAVARGVYEATALPCAPAFPAWRDRFGRR